MGDLLYTYRTGDDVCTPFRTDDPVQAAGLYADENGAGQVFVVVGDRIDMFIVDRSPDEGCDWRVTRARSDLGPLGWFHSAVPCQWHLGWTGLSVRARRAHNDVMTTMPGGGQDFYGPDTLAVAIARCDCAETEAVLRMAAHVAWGGRDVRS